jgi:death-on-curing protein
MVAASTHVLACFVQGTMAVVDCATISSQGVLMLATSVVHLVPGSQDSALSVQATSRGCPAQGLLGRGFDFHVSGAIHSKLRPLSYPSTSAMANRSARVGRGAEVLPEKCGSVAAFSASRGDGCPRGLGRRQPRIARAPRQVNVGLLTVAEVYQMQHRLIDMFGSMHGVRDKGAIEAAAFRPQTGCYNSLGEEAAALMESLGKNHGFLDGNKCITFTAADVFLRRKRFLYRGRSRIRLRFHQWLDGTTRIPLRPDPALDAEAPPAVKITSTTDN